MKKRFLTVIAVAILAALAMILGSCGDRQSPYEDLGEEGYTVTVRYDAGGADFAANGTYMSLFDVYHSGAGAIKLFDPDDEAVRGTYHYDAERTVPFENYKLDGWYVVEQDENGNVVYRDGEPVYLKKWDFENDRYQIESSRTYTAGVPALTLMARWVPHYTYEVYYQNESGEWLAFTTGEDGKSFTHSGDSILMPRLDFILNSDGSYSSGRGTWSFYDFNPEKTGEAALFAGKTFVGAYLDPECTIPATETVPGGANTVTGEDYYELFPELDPEDDAVKIYTKWEDGKSYQVFYAKQLGALLATAEAGAVLNIRADLDFAGIDWTLDAGTLKHKIRGNGHRFTGISAEQDPDTLARATHGGLFMEIGSGAEICDLTIVSSTYTVYGSNVSGATFGFLAGRVSDDATVKDVTLGEGCQLIIADSTLANKPLLEKITDYSTLLYAAFDGATDEIEFSRLNVSAGRLEWEIEYGDADIYSGINFFN